MICAGNVNNQRDIVQGPQDTCRGDSGGPLIYNRYGSYELHGVTSFTISCQGYPSVYSSMRGNYRVTLVSIEG